VEMHAHVPKMGRTLGHWLLEGLFIVISVALGFWVTQVREERQNRALATRILKGLETEVQYNLSTLEPFADIQDRWVEAMAKLGDAKDQRTGFPVCPTSSTACGVFSATRPDLGEMKSSFPLFRRAAWDTAVSTEALRLLELRFGRSSIRDLPDAGTVSRQYGQGRRFFDGLVRPGCSRRDGS